MNAHTRRRKPRTRSVVAWLALPATALAVVGCSSGPGTPQVAHLPGHAARSPAAGQLTVAQSDRDMVDFARCMRGHGVQMPDPFHRAGHSGLSISLPEQTAANRPAFTACMHFLQPIIAMKQAGAVAQAAPELPALTDYARCMRAHDIGMLDPTPEGELNLGRVPGIDRCLRPVLAAVPGGRPACRHFLPAGVHDNGTGP